MRKRNCRVEVCFTKDELTVLSKKAKKAGLSIGGFVRHSVADKEIKEAPPADIPMLLRAMRQAGYNLDQTLKRFNTTNVPDTPAPNKEEAQTQNPTQGPAAKSRPSEPTSNQREKTVRGISDPTERSRPSVRQEMKEIREEQRQRTSSAQKSKDEPNRTSEHRPVPKMKKDKER